MRKIGVFAGLLALAALGADVLLRLLGRSGHSMWLPGTCLLFVSGASFAWDRWRSGRPAAAAPETPGALDTAKLLDNFEQRFAELKARKPNATVLGDLYELGTQLEQRTRIPQATAVYRHLVRIEPGYEDVGERLHRLLDKERLATSAMPTRAAGSRSFAVAAVGASGLGVPSRPRLVAAGAGSVTASRSMSSAALTSAPGTARAPAGAPSGVPAEASTTPLRQLGRYRLEREIGRGAMGIVYLGRDMAINRAVAIKAIPLAKEFSDGELHEARVRFFREAETAGRLNHPNIVTIYDVGEEGGLAYIAMEYLKGRHLSEYVEANHLLEPRKVLELVARTADALGFAHKQEVVHRDIKPANLMYDPTTDVLKITDFGIARLTGAGSTRTGIVLGTPSFMSPEQLEGRIVTGHSDLFSLGVSLFQLLTGQLPFVADSMTGLMRQIAESPHPPLRAYRPDLPACIEYVIDRALAKSPEARFDTGAQMAAALEDCRVRIPSGMP